MTEADKVFSLFPDFIKEYIYSHGWSELRDIQLTAADVILRSDDNLLLCSSTASGKTEAVFFPIITEIIKEPADSGISVLYVAPLKSLINDQFSRLDELLDASGIKVTHWHGDVGAGHKSALLKNPSGILQITPESLESMLINRSNDIPRLFGSLKFVVVDEIHALMGADRGNQVMCQLKRIAEAIGRHPRRIGLSATVGDPGEVARWLGEGSGRKTFVENPPRTSLKWRLALEHFYVEDTREDQVEEPLESADKPRASLDAGYEFLYDSVYGKKAIIFSNSREETEYVTATLRQIARSRSDEDVFLIHHGNLSAAIREGAEETLKDESVASAVACATVTMELGIDIGKLQRVCQVGAPTSVSSFLQRLGRSGRRGSPPEMVMLFREETPVPNAPINELIPWELLRGIAIIELYSSERFVEPPRLKKMPLSLAFHQTLSILAAASELSPKRLAEKVLGLPALSSISRATYKEMLVSMVRDEFLELTEIGTLIIGLKGEQVINNFKFYAVFKDSEDFTVRYGSEEIGTITTPPPVGDRFALAGRVWEVVETDLVRHLIFVDAVDGKMAVSWPGDSGEIHTKLMLAVREVLFNGKSYAFLGKNAAKRLDCVRGVAKNAGMDKKCLIFLGGQSYVFFPWLGTRSFKTMRRILSHNAGKLGISDIQSEGCCFIKFKAKPEAAEELFSNIEKIIADGLTTDMLVGDGECPVFDKYDEHIEPGLLRAAYAADRLSLEEIKERFAGGYYV